MVSTLSTILALFRRSNPLLLDDFPAYWQALGKRFDAKGMGDIRGVRFEDINGDVSLALATVTKPLELVCADKITLKGRDDWIWVSDTGATTT